MEQHLTQATSALREQLQVAAASLAPFPSFMGRGWLQAVEVEPPAGPTDERGCVVVCPAGELYELVLRLLPGAEVVSDPEPTEELVPLQLLDSEYVRWAQAAIQALSAHVSPC